MTTTTTKYQVQFTVPGDCYSPQSWNCKRDGRPTAANLQRFVESFEASTRPGGCNAHLGPVTVQSARIALNGGSFAIVAKYEVPVAPLFLIVTTDYHNVKEG